MNVKFVAPFSDYTGYGAAARNTIAALNSAGVDITTEKIDFIADKIDTGWMGGLAEAFVDRPLNYKIKIIELTAEHYPTYIEKDKYNIGVLFWETDRIPAKWVKPMNMMNEFWVFSEPTAEVFRKSGITSKLTVFPQCMDYSYYKNVTPYDLKGEYKFYSIFQWTERKNPKALIQAFLKAFPYNDKVRLFIKAYRSNFTKAEFVAIREDAARWRKEITDSPFPQIDLITNMLSNNDIIRLHQSCDCFVSAHRGEGWGMPQMEALALGKPVISTGYGGIHDWLTNKEAFLAPFKMVQVKGMEWIPWYTPDQLWADVSSHYLIDRMQYVYKNQKEAKKMGELAKIKTESMFDYHVVGPQMRKRLEEI